MDADFNVGNLRAALDGLPDDMPVMVYYDSYLGSGPCDWIEVVEEQRLERYVIERHLAVGTG